MQSTEQSASGVVAVVRLSRDGRRDAGTVSRCTPDLTELTDSHPELKVSVCCIKLR